MNIERLNHVCIELEESQIQFFLYGTSYTLCSAPNYGKTAHHIMGNFVLCKLNVLQFLILKTSKQAHSHFRL